MGKTWSYSAGERGNRVRVFERTVGGRLYIAIADPTRPGRYLRRSLGHRDRPEAMCEADEASAALRRQGDRLRRRRITWAELFALYARHHVPRLSARGRRTAEVRLEMWARFLGGRNDPSRLTRREWDAFIDARLGGTLDARGRERRSRVPMRPGTVCSELAFLRAVCRWGRDWRTASGRTLLKRDPTRGLAMPPDKNPRRPVADLGRLAATRAVAPQVRTRFFWGAYPRGRPSYLLEILDIVAGTGRRIGAVRQLRYEDLRMAGTPEQPFGAIRWPAQTDKTGREMIVPVTPTVRAALDRIMADRPGVGRAYLFPGIRDPAKPVSAKTVDDWLRLAERRAGLEPLDGGLWHPYRRMWATRRKHLPLPDLARAGGWASQQTLQACYLHDDAETTLRVVLADEDETPEHVDVGTEVDTA
ncbi:tyrosine-type recombinase/integrase [Candidatus Palauibacter sp.]|uniref:tyrosine-type recombinase/integrase n=1 Tax=Candidatus Palauibacter sp. TaxID=3101350 RepID=UPI003CC5069E